MLLVLVFNNHYTAQSVFTWDDEMKQKSCLSSFERKLLTSKSQTHLVPATDIETFVGDYNHEEK